jgi:protein-disulfide isomerase
MTIFRRFATIKLLSMKNILHTCAALLIVATAAVAQSRPAPKPSSKPPAASAPAAKTDLPSEDTVNAFLFQMFGYDPTITWKVQDIRPSDAAGLSEVSVLLSNSQGSNATKLYITADGKHAISGDVMPFGAHPFDDARAKLDKGLNGVAKGPEHAPVTVVEFSDMQCPHCRQAAPNIEQLLALEPDVHFVFQNFPLPAHDWAEKAAAYVDCVGRASNDAVWKFIQKTFDQQSNITEANADGKLKAIATDSGVKADEIAACAAKPDTKARVEASIELGKSVGVTGTPALFINGRPLGGGAPVDVLQKVVEFQAKNGKASAPAN